MSKNTNKKKNSNLINELVKLINYHDDLYYNKNFQEISDEEYDSLRIKLLELENKYPSLVKRDTPNLRVGSFSKSKFKTIEHKIPMLSLNNAYEAEEVKSFYQRVSKLVNGNPQIFAETKVDGLSASLRYENRNLKIALTRGDGVKGEDITRNVKFIHGVKKKLPDSFPKELEIRGEIFMPKDIFSKLNSDRKKKGLELFSTTRNAAAGSVRQLDPYITKARGLRFFGYTVLSENNILGYSIEAIRKKLIKNGFDLNEPSRVCNSLGDMLDFHQFISENRASLNYDIDGIVYKLNIIEDHKILGSTNRYPRWALAHKFPSEVNYSKIEKVIFQVGRTGSITPVASLKPVLIGGVKISRATLHNEDEIKRLDLRIGDTVSLQRAGDVIPKIVSVIKEKRDKENCKLIKIPDECPSCGNKLYKEEGEVVIRCLNYDSCEEQLLKKLYHFVSRDAFNIEGLGERVINSFWSKGFIRKYSDIFNLENKIKSNSIDLLSMEGWGQKSVVNLIFSINNSKQINFDKFIFSLGIRHIGKGVSILLSSKYNSIHELVNAFKKNSYTNTLKIDGIGEVMIKSLKEYFSMSSNLEEINKIINFIDITYIKKKMINIYSGKTFAITGKFDGQSRAEIQDKINLFGSKVSSSLSKKTDFLLVGKDPGSKLKKARVLNVRLLYSGDLKKIIEN